MIFEHVKEVTFKDVVFYDNGYKLKKKPKKTQKTNFLFKLSLCNFDR